MFEKPTTYGNWMSDDGSLIGGTRFYLMDRPNKRFIRSASYVCEVPEVADMVRRVAAGDCEQRFIDSLQQTGECYGWPVFTLPAHV